MKISVHSPFKRHLLESVAGRGLSKKSSSAHHPVTLDPARSDGPSVGLLANSTSCDSLAPRTLGEADLEQQHIISFIFSLNRWFISAYANGLTAELNMIMVWPMEPAKRLSSFEPISKMWRILSVPQLITKMTLTVTTIKVTRFRTFNTPCEQRDK